MDRTTAARRHRHSTMATLATVVFASMFLGLISNPVRTVAASELGAWSYGTDLIAQSANATNGGATISGFSSAAGEVPEECISGSYSACGRGEFGGPEPFGAVVLNNLDPANRSLTFGCPSTATGHSVQSGTQTATSGGPPAVSLFPGDFTGGSGGSPPTSTNVSGDNQCYSPYVSCSASAGTNNNGAGINQCSAALGTGTNSVAGFAYEAATTDSCNGGASPCLKRILNTAWYIPPTAGGNTAGSACSGQVLAAGGEAPGAGNQASVCAGLRRRTRRRMSLLAPSCFSRSRRYRM